VLVRIWFIAQQVNKGATHATGSRPSDEPPERQEIGGDLYREYRHDAVALRYDGIMLLLVRLIVAILHSTHLSRYGRCHDAGR